VTGSWTATSSNFLDGAAPFYTTYETKDGEHMAVGALEPQFFAELVRLLDIDPESIPAQTDRDRWPEMRNAFANRFAQRTREEWAAHFEGTDACVAPVLSMSEAPTHPHNQARRTFIDLEGIPQPGSAPRFSETPAAVGSGPVAPGADTEAVMAELGYTPREISMLRESGSVA
jgi:alpha-methylacyl-CoA racemase